MLYKVATEGSDRPSTPASRKRAVLVHRSGLVRILGAVVLTANMPTPYIELMIDGEHVQAGLIRVTPRQVVYRQIVDGPKTGKLGEFHPEQR